MIGKLSRPSSEPLYSGGSRSHFPIPFDYIKAAYGSFVGSHLKNTQNMLIWQEISQNKFSGVFGQSKLHCPQPSTRWNKASSYKSLMEWIKTPYMFRNIYSLAFDGTSSDHYAAYLMDGYGSTQSLLVSSDQVSTCWKEGNQITSCTADYSNFYFVMTMEAPNFKQHQQSYSINDSWKKISEKIQSGYREGRVITGLCYCSGKGQYLLVMTESAERQCYSWFSPKEEENRDIWIKQKHVEGYHPTIIMMDPTDNHVLIVSTSTTDSNRSNFLCRHHRLIRSAKTDRLPLCCLGRNGNSVS